MPAVAAATQAEARCSSRARLPVMYHYARVRLGEVDGHDAVPRPAAGRAFYPITGDSSRKIFDAQSSNRFYARVERGRSFALFGDVLATTLSSDARRLGVFNRR